MSGSGFFCFWVIGQRHQSASAKLGWLASGAAAEQREGADGEQ